MKELMAFQIFKNINHVHTLKLSVAKESYWGARLYLFFLNFFPFVGQIIIYYDSIMVPVI